mgnify:CR=1 FL=1
MNKDDISALLKEKGVTDEQMIEDLSGLIEDQHNEAVQSLAQNKSLILDEKKKLQNEFKELETSKTELASKLELYKDIPDPTVALKALKLMESGAGERDVEKEIQEAVQNRTISLIEENTQIKSEIDKIQKEKEAQADKFVKQSREKDFENQITISAQKNDIDARLMEEYRFNIKRIFNEYDEDLNRYVAKDDSGRQIFGKKQTTQPVDIDLYTVDYLIPEKSFFKKGNFNNPSLGGNPDTGPDYSNLFYMKNGVAKPTSEGFAFKAENAATPEKFELAKQKFEKKNKAAEAA